MTDYTKLATWKSRRSGERILVNTPTGCHSLSRGDAKALLVSLQESLSDGSTLERTRWADEWLKEHPIARYYELCTAMETAGLAPVSVSTVSRLRRENGLPKLTPGPTRKIKL